MRFCLTWVLRIPSLELVRLTTGASYVSITNIVRRSTRARADTSPPRRGLAGDHQRTGRHRDDQPHDPGRPDEGHRSQERAGDSGGVLAVGHPEERQEEAAWGP